MRTAGWKRVAGFTLAELMVTVVVVMTVLVVALPSYRTIIRNARLVTQIYDFDAALNFARSEAVKRGYAVSVCPSTDRATCTGGTQWEQGWIVFVDADGDHTVDTSDGREVVLRTTSALESGYTLRGSSAVASFVTFNPRGQASGTGQFNLCENLTVDPSRAVLVNAIGRTWIADDHDGIPKDALGNDMTTCTPT